MDAKKFKQLIKEAVREALREELAYMGKSKLKESMSSEEAWPTMNFTTQNTNPALRNSLAEQMGLIPPKMPNVNFGQQSSKPFSYEDILAQTAAELRSNPAEIQHFKSIGGVE